MGQIYYGTSSDPIEIDDRTLAHLRIVISSKLRRNESFTLSWRHPEAAPAGRSTLWLHPSIPLRFQFDGGMPADISQKWLTELSVSANTSGGILLTPEHIAPADDEHAPLAPAGDTAGIG